MKYTTVVKHAGIFSGESMRVCVSSELASVLCWLSTGWRTRDSTGVWLNDWDINTPQESNN